MQNSNMKTVLLVALALAAFGSDSSQQVAGLPAPEVAAEGKLLAARPPQQLYPLSDQEFNFIRTLRTIAKRQLNANRARNSLDNNQPDVELVLLKTPAQSRVNNRHRLQRSLESLQGANIAPGQFPAAQHSTPAAASQKELQIYQDEQAFKRQLPDLIAQAHTDKALERALLRMLINTSLSLDSAAPPAAPSPAGSLAENNLAAGKLLQQQQQLDSYANIDPFVSDAATRGLSPGADQEAFLANTVDKRESKPCLFNAIDCLRSPYGRNSEI